MLQIYNKYGQLKVVSSTSSTGVSSVSGVSPITSTGGSNPIISTLVTPNKLLGRYSPSTGPMQEILIGTGLSLVGNTLNSTSVVTANALTRVNDTNVTLTLGGTPATALLQNVSLTLGWTGTLADSRITSASVWNAKQDALSGTGFVKSTAGVISYDTSIYTPTSRTLTINGTTYDLSADRSWTIATSSGTVTSVGLTVPPAFNVTPSTITTAGTFAITGAGTASQYIRGDGALATLPTGGGGGSTVSYYLNGSIPSSVVGYQQMDNEGVIGGGTDFTLTGNGLIAQFLTDIGNPNRIEIPGGAWNFEMYFQASSSGGNVKFYVELLKYNGSTFSLISSSVSVPEEITGGTSIDLYLTSLAVPTTPLLVTDRLAIRVYIVDNAGGRTITLHTEDNTLCEIITTFSGGITSLDGLTANTQYLAVGTSGTDFNISSVTDTHTFNLPTASATNRGALSSADWTNFNTAYTDRLKWDGGASGLVAATGRTSLGANTVGSNLFTLTNPSAVTFVRINADNTISTLDATTFRTAIGAGTVTGAGLTDQLAYFPLNGSAIAGLDTTTYPSLTELSYVKGVTSNIQTQLDSKPSSSALIKKVLSNTVATATVSGTTLQTLIYSAPVILGGTFSYDDFFNFQATFRKQPGNAITCTYRFYISNTNNFATASLLATWASLRFNTVVERKNIFFKANGTINTPLLPSTTAQTDITNQDTAVTSLAVTPVNDIYFFVSVQFTGIGDQVQMTAIKIQN